MAKRGQNEGSIHKRQDGRWVAVANLGYHDGKRRRKYFYGRTRHDVQLRLTKALRDQQQGLPIPGERQTVGQFLTHWLTESAKPTIRPSTYRSYEQLVRVHLIPGLGRVPLSKLSPQDVQAFLNRKLAAGLSPRTVQYHHAVLRRALGRALRWGLIPRNVTTLVDPPRGPRPEVRPLTPTEARTFLAAVQGHRLEALYSVAIALGLRQGEALGVRWEDIDLDQATLTVRVALQRVDGKFHLVEPKTARSRRALALPDVAVAALRAHRIRQAQERLLIGSRWHKIGLVFTTTTGKPLDARNVIRHFQKVLKKEGLPPQRFHDLRHTCASLLLAQGVHPRVVMEILGHSQISLTMNTYSHVIPQLQREAAGQMDALLAAK